MLARAADSAHRVLSGVADGSVDTFRGEVGVAADGVERRAQIVRHRREELALRPVGALGFRPRRGNLLARMYLARHIDGVDEDAGRVAVRIPERLIDEVDVQRSGASDIAAVEANEPLALRVRRAGAEDRIEQLENSLILQFRERLSHGAANDVALPDQLLIERVGDRKDMLRTLEHGD